MSNSATQDPLLLERAYIEGWVLALTFGAEEELRKGNMGLGMVLVVMTIVGQTIVTKWAKMRGALATRIPTSLDRFNKLASDPRWWIATLMAFLLFVALSPFAQEGKLPSIPFVNGWQANLETAKQQIVSLQSQLATAIRERDAARQAATPSADTRGAPAQIALPNSIGPQKNLTNEMKKRLIDSALTLKPNVKSVIINISSNATGTLLHGFAEVFNRAGFGQDNVRTGTQEPANPAETGVMICIADVNHPSETDMFIKKMLHDVGIETSFIPLSEAEYRGDVTIFIGPDPL